MASLLGEVRRRKIFQVAAAYLVVAWLVVQVVTSVADPLGFPAWVESLVIVLLAIGFPVTMVMSWAFNLTPEGLVRDYGNGSSAAGGGRSMEQILIGLLVIAVGWLLYQDVRGPNEAAPASAAVPATEPVTVEGTVEPAPTSSRLPNSIAVLPFDNLSPDPNNEFFAAGIHEEILNQLVKLRNLNVIARTSVMQYAGAARPITEIAKELNVETIMEGSVSYADGRVAVAAQLIDAATGVHIWSERYNAEYANVFEIQTDMAMNIANALEAQFSATEQASLAEIPTTSLDAYTLYLQALNVDDVLAAGRLLDEAIRLDPEFAVAYALKAQRYALRGRGADSGAGKNWEDVVREAAARAIEIDPGLATPYAALASLHHANWQWSEAEEAFAQAYELNPNDSRILGAYATLKRDVGDYADAIRLWQRAVQLDPDAGGQLGITLRYARDYDGAAQAHRRLLSRNPANGAQHMQLAFAEIASGSPDTGLQELQTAERLGIAGSFFRNTQLALAYRHLNRPDDVERLLAPLLESSDAAGFRASERAMAYLALGDYDQARQEFSVALEDPIGESLVLLGQIKANDYGDPVLDEPEWQALRDRIGSL